MRAVVALRTSGRKYTSLSALLQRVQDFLNGRCVLTIKGHWTILVVGGLARLRVEGFCLPGYRFPREIPL